MSIVVIVELKIWASLKFTGMEYVDVCIQLLLTWSDVATGLHEGGE